MRSRVLLALSACVLVTAAWLRPVAAPDPVWSTQLHVHGSYSEGQGSIESHLFEARELGLDVLWWSDHDFRITSYRPASTFAFEAESEPIDTGEAWTALGASQLAHTKSLRSTERTRPGRGRAEFTTENSRDGSRCLQLRRDGQGDDKFRSLGRQFVAHRGVHHRPLASVITVHVAAFPTDHDADGRGIVEVDLSEHPVGAPSEGGEGGELVRHRLRYYLTNDETEPVLDGATLHVPVPFVPDTWNDLELELTRDAIAGFPAFEGADNSLGVLRLGVEARRDARPTVSFDDLRIEQEVAGPESMAVQRALFDEVGRRYPGLLQHQGLELSYWSMHLNEFSVETVPPDYDAWLVDSGMLTEAEPFLDEEAFGVYAAERAVREVHARGGLVSYNHLFNFSEIGGAESPTREEALEILTRTRLHGADLLEVGYRDRKGRTLDDYLWVWDRLAERGQFPVGIGVSDSHGGPAGRWRGTPNNLVSWIFAPTTSKADLIEGLRAGRVFFGDLELFDGRLELESARGFRMGEIVLTDRDTARVQVRVEGLAEGDAVTCVEAGGLERALGTATASEFAGDHVLASVPGFARFEVRNAAGTVKLLSNPIHYVSAAPEGGLPPARAALDVGGVRSRGLRGLTLAAACVEPVDGHRMLRIEGRAVAGEVRLEFPHPIDLDRLRWEGLEGEASAEGELVVLSDLGGSGSVLLPLEPARKR